MNLIELKGKELLAKYGIPIPKGIAIDSKNFNSSLPFPVIVKSQVPVGDRKRKGGIEIVKTAAQYSKAVPKLLKKSIDGHVPEQLLVEELVPFEQEHYVSFTFDTDTRSPMLALSSKGGTGISRAATISLNLAWPRSQFFVRDALRQAGLPLDRPLIKIVESLWKLFVSEKAILAEINPLFRISADQYVAGDAKIILDDHIVDPDHRSYVELGGDIAILASGGGASMVNLDALMRAGGQPANYVEYSGNPKSDIVRDLTHRVLSQPGLKGCWVVGGTANFTDIYETLKGFIDGLREVIPKPTYPIVIRRDGPRREEAFKLLQEVKEKEGFNFHLFGPETPMAKSAKTIVKLSYEHSR